MTYCILKHCIQFRLQPPLTCIARFVTTFSLKDLVLRMSGLKVQSRYKVPSAARVLCSVRCRRAAIVWATSLPHNLLIPVDTSLQDARAKSSRLS